MWVTPPTPDPLPLPRPALCLVVVVVVVGGATLAHLGPLVACSASFSFRAGWGGVRLWARGTSLAPAVCLGVTHTSVDPPASDPLPLTWDGPAVSYTDPAGTDGSPRSAFPTSLPGAKHHHHPSCRSGH